MVLVFTHQLSTAAEQSSPLTLSLTAEERTRSRHRFTADSGEAIYLDLPRGTVLHGGDQLGNEADDRVLKIEAKPEPVITVRAPNQQALLRAAYHLGNRHVSLEVTPDYLRLLPDPVLEHMLQHLGVEVVAETAPFEPESGAYGSGVHGSGVHGSDHQHEPTQVHSHGSHEH